MKNNLLVCLAIILTAAISCKEEIQTISAEGKIPVTFSISGFNASVKGISDKIYSDSLKSVASNLSCYVYNAVSGELVATLNQTKANPNFGTVSFDLPAGSYKAAFVASGGTIDWASANTFTSAYFQTFSSAPQQTFFKLVDSIQVNQPVTKTVELKRIVAGLEVILEDSIPSSVSKITLVVENEALNFKVSEQLAKGYFTRSYPFTISATDRHLLNKSFATYILPNTLGYKMNVRIKAFNTAGQEILEKVVPNVLFEVNKKTVLKGKLFDSLGSGSSFNITVDTEWDGTLPVVTF